MSACRTRPAVLAGFLLSLSGVVALGAIPITAAAQSTTVAGQVSTFDIPAQDLGAALTEFARQSGQEMLYAPGIVAGKTSSALSGEMSRDTAMVELLKGTGLKHEIHDSGSMIIGDEASIQAYRARLQTSASGTSAMDATPDAASAGDDNEAATVTRVETGRRGGVEEIIVTAQKRAERIQDIPISISAFTQDDLTRTQIAGGPDLITQIPNFTFTKTNFSGYSIQIRGIGTQAISATTDPAVAVAFNNTPFIRNRFFEQEFYDLDRVEILRGPQGTLYGRNATAGVVNLISAKPEFFSEARVSADMGNYNSHRVEQMVNIPLVEDVAALRFAGAWTKRDGYATNDITGNPIDGRDLWSTRTSLRIKPNDIVEANLIWEHFEENDDRIRSGKQLCDKHVVTEVAGWAIAYDKLLANAGQGGRLSNAQVTLSQGCKRNSLYSSDSFQTPNGLMLPYYVPLGGIGLPVALDDPYLSTVQSRDLRKIESTIDPIYKARSDIGELQINVAITDDLTITSETGYSDDTVYSLQDFNRFNTAPGAWLQPGVPSSTFPGSNILTSGPAGGIFCDPQLGCSDRLVAVDISTAKSRQFSQELRLASSFDGPFNFSLGANYLRYATEDKYYIFFNSLSLIAAKGSSSHQSYTRPVYVPGVSDNGMCLPNGYAPGDPSYTYGVTQCVYMDPNPISNVNDQGHNYFLSRNPYELHSYALFGETYWNITPSLKLTTGLRWSVDKKEAPRIPTWALASLTVGYPVADVIKQEWQEPTGRIVLDWKPDLSFTDETMVYGSVGRGYKAGGANPPSYVSTYYSNPIQALGVAANSATRPRTFDPEFVNAFEVGTKNTLLDGALSLNLAAFYYDYKAYQISEIVDRSAYNRNFDAKIWGLEIETDFYPWEFLKLGFKGGYQKTRIGDGEKAVDLMDRTAGNPDWVVVRPFPTYASSCILPEFLFDGLDWDNTPGPTNVGGVAGGSAGGCEIAYLSGHDPVTNLPYVADPTVQGGSGTLGRHPGYIGWDPATAPNNGEGFDKDLSGNELPNAPNFTATFSGDLTLPMSADWTVALHVDVHWQDKSWWRVFNDHEYGRLDDYWTSNFAAIFVNERAGWNVMAYVKNVFDETAISGAFLNSDDTGLTTNVFLTEPRLYGLRVTKTWGGESTLGGFGQRFDANHVWPLYLELGGQTQRVSGGSEAAQPTFANAFAAPLDIFAGEQDVDTGWGQTKEIKLGWRQDAGPWMLSVGYRHGDVSHKQRGGAQWGTEPACAMTGGLPAMEAFCTNPNAPFLYLTLQDISFTNRVATQTQAFENYRLFDVAVSRELPINGLSKSRLELALRQLRMNSQSIASIEGVPDWFMPQNADIFAVATRPVTHTTYQASFDMQRSFSGTGPVLTWAASLPLFGNPQVGKVDLDWSLIGGVLMGSQNTTIADSKESEWHYRWTASQSVGFQQPPQQPTTNTQRTVDGAKRSNSQEVPLVGATLGLSYRVSALSLMAGYRWERYMDVLDGGVTSHQKYDRTIEGPTLKLGIDFGS